MRVLFDDSIIQDTEAEKRQDMAEIAAGLMGASRLQMPISANVYLLMARFISSVTGSRLGGLPGYFRSAINLR